MDPSEQQPSKRKAEIARTVLFGLAILVLGGLAFKGLVTGAVAVGVISALVIRPPELKRLRRAQPSEPQPAKVE